MLPRVWGVLWKGVTRGLLRLLPSGVFLRGNGDDLGIENIEGEDIGPGVIIVSGF
jgi:hypothetical protein